MMMMLQMTRRQPAGFPSLLGHLSSTDLVHQFYVMLPSADASDNGLTRTFRPLSSTSNLPCDLQVINLRAIPKSTLTSQSAGVRSTSALILHRAGIDCSYRNHPSLTFCHPGWGNVSFFNATRSVNITMQFSVGTLEN